MSPHPVQRNNGLYTILVMHLKYPSTWRNNIWFLPIPLTTCLRFANSTYVRRCCTKSVLNPMRCEGRLPSSTHRGTATWTTCQVICSPITQLCTPTREGLICIHEYASFSEPFLWCHFLFTYWGWFCTLNPHQWNGPKSRTKVFRVSFKHSCCLQPFSSTQTQSLLGEICV